MTTDTTATHYQQLDAGHDTNGNPRRVFVLYNAEGDIVHVAGYEYQNPPKECRALVQLPGFTIKPADYRQLLRDYK